MNEIKQEIISIRRTTDTLDGQVISYLKSTPLKLDQDFSELLMSTLKKYWLPLALFSLDVRGEELRQIGIWAISELEAQSNIIRRICGITPDSLVRASNVELQAFAIGEEKHASILQSIAETQQISSSQEEDEEYDDDDEGCIEMEQPQEMIMANKALGFSN
ncbi:hypothetical protein A6770_34820 [Nostoc minutum NIES-26]|uniref:Uncharacterized protein n=1 Tax=Nostoc minutum NIES-26 TaxID=1844469 RepID=A0A367S580_9NOSO|nr:hypothetical protein A6770_34820 [Nostoc minutum NIES-26]